MLGCEPLYQLQVALALIVGALSQLAVEGIDAFLHTGHAGKSLACLVYHGCVVLQVHHLRQIAYGGVAGDRHHASRRLLQATEYLQHGRLACPVLAHKGNAVALVDNETDIAEQWLHAKFHRKSFNGNHQ